MEYVIKRNEREPSISNWEEGLWQSIETIELSEFRPESSNHRPITELKLQYIDKGLFGMFRVRDQYIKCVHKGFQVPVCRDSCVECFVKPLPDKGYFNFEFNCGGALLCHYVEDHRRTRWGFRKHTKLKEEELQQVMVYHSLPETVKPEIRSKKVWFLGFHIPLRILENYVGVLGDLSGKQWTANFYKCGDNTSHPHWGSWQPVKRLNFHLPDCFGAICFE